MSDKISLKGLNKAAVLASLYNVSRPLGMGFMSYDPKPMTVEEAQKILEHDTDLDYLKGRVMKINLSGEELDPWLYDRDNGNGAAKRAIESLQSTGDVNSERIELDHREGTHNSALELKGNLAEESHFEETDGVQVLKLGFDEFAPELNRKVDKTIEGDEEKDEKD